MSIIKSIIFKPVFALISFTAVAQTYFIQEDFNGCAVPANWSSITLGAGWQIGTSAALESPTFPIPDNGSCIAVVNDAVVPGNNASIDALVMPKIDITGVNNLIFRYDAITPAGLSFFYIEYSFDSTNWHTGYSNNQVLASPVWETIEFPANGGFFQGGNDLWLRLRYKDFNNNTMGIAIDNFVVYEPAANDLKLTVVSNNEWSTLGSQDIKGEIWNYGSNAINNFTLNWQFNNGPVNSQIINAFTYGNSLSPFVKSRFEKLNAYSLSATGSYVLKVWTSLPNGMPDSNPFNDTVVAIVNGANSLPEKRVLLEKYMHNTCGPCYPANAHFQIMLAEHPFVTGVSIHASSIDPFTIPEGNILNTAYTTAHPTFVADRKILETNPSFRMDQYLGETDDLNLAVQDEQAVAVAITNFSYNEITNIIQFDVEATFYGDYTTDLGINAYVTEDSVFGYQFGAPDPNNYYHNHVVRAILGGSWGAPFQMSDVVGNSYSKTFQYHVPANQNPENFNFVGFVQKIDTTIPNRHILNCTPEIEMSALNGLSVNEIELNDKVKIVPNPFEDVFSIEINSSSATEVKIFSLNGSLVYQNSHYKSHKNINLSNLEGGVYLLSVSTEEGLQTRKLIVKK